MKHDSTLLLGGSMNLIVPRQDNIASPVRNQLAVNDKLRLVRYDGSWQDMVSFEEDLYEFTTHLFTTADTIGHTGPTDLQLQAAYADAPFVSDLNLFWSEDGIQKWVVPSTGVYEFDVHGARIHSSYSRAARLTFSLKLDIGDVISMLVGQRGASSLSGCGACFIESESLGLLAVVGGSGGRYRSTAVAAYGALSRTLASDTAGANSAFNGITRATGGASYSASTAQPSGASNASLNGLPSKSYLEGGLGGRGTSSYLSGNNYVTSTGDRGGFGGGGGGGGGSTEGFYSSGSSSYKAAGGGGGMPGGIARVSSGRFESLSIFADNGGSYLVDSDRILDHIYTYHTVDLEGGTIRITRL